MTGAFTTALMGAFVLTGLAGSPLAVASTTNPIQVPTNPSYTVSLTGYNAVAAQTDSDPSMTASGAYSNPDVIVARSKDLAEELPFGTIISISPTTRSNPSCGLNAVSDYVGYRVVADAMHPRKRHQIDIMFDDQASMRVGGKILNPARVLGICKDITITVVGFVDINKIPDNQTQLRALVGAQTLAFNK